MDAIVENTIKKEELSYFFYVRKSFVHKNAYFCGIMRTKTSLCILLLLLFTTFIPTYTLAQDVNARIITTADGLSNNTVRHIYQDSRGFLWLSTLDGLNRYDGHNVVAFKPASGNQPTLFDRRIQGVMEDKNGFLWVSTSSNIVSCLDIKREHFVDFTGCGEYTRHYRKMEQMSDGVWLWGDEGCLRTTWRNGKWVSENFTKENGKLRDSYVTRVTEAKCGVWLLTRKGLYLYNKGKTTLVAPDIDLMWATVYGSKTFFAAYNGTIWMHDGKMHRIGQLPGVTNSRDIPGQLTIGHKWYIFASTGGYAIDMETASIEKATGGLDIKTAHVTTDNHGNHWLYNGTGLLRRVDGKTGETIDLHLMTGASVKNIDQERYHVVVAKNGKAWISTYGNGLFVYDNRTGELRHFASDTMAGKMMQSNQLLYVYEDHMGSIWVGSWHSGLSQIKMTDEGVCSRLKASQPAIHGQVRLLWTEPTGTLWMGTSTGELLRSDAMLNNVETVSSGDGRIYAVCRDRKGQLWIGSRTKGVKVNGKWYTNDMNDKTSIGENAVYAIEQDRRGRIWIATLGGGLNLAVADGKGGYAFQRFFTDNNGQSRTRCLLIDNNGWMWLGTSAGLAVFNPDRLLRNANDYHLYCWDNNKLRSNEIRSLMNDSHGRIWISEAGEGFCICQPGQDYSKLSFTHYGVSDGLANSMVQAFAEDGQGRVWVSTEYGMSCFTPSSKTFRNFFFAPTMAGNTYSENSAARLSDGRLLFGTDTGVAVIDPRLVKAEKRHGGITFTQLAIGGIIVHPDTPDYPLDMALPYAAEIKLNHNQNSITIYFSTLDFANTAQTRYSYWLEGHDKSWSQPSSMDFAAYKDLDPGTYILHVKATDGEGAWMPGESVVKVVITPPWWASPWAYAVYFIIAAIAIYVALRTLRRMDALRTQVKVEEQMADYKLAFFTNISHEFRTPLTLIQAAMERMKKASSTTERTTAVRLMDQSVNRMLRLINELLEFRKAEKGALSLQLERTDIVPLLKSIFEAFSESAVNKKMAYTFDTQLKSLVMPIDRDKLDKIVNNLLSNAFKYTPAGGKVMLTASVDSERQSLTVKVADTGIGIPKEKRAKMFTRYATGNTVRGSMGIGLHLVSELVKCHMGSIDYEENPGGGSVFVVTLPTTDTVYTEDDYLKTALSEENVTTTAEQTVDQEKQLLDSDERPQIEPMNDRTILVIEDDDDVRSLLVEELSAYTTVVAKPDGKAGYEYARTNDVDLILCDVMMPGMDGFEVTRRLKDDFDTSHIPVILLTALSAEESRLKGAQCGADGYVTKPFSIRLLLTQVLKTIEQREKLKEKFSSDTTTVRPLMSTTDKDKAFIDKLTKVIGDNISNENFTIDDFSDAMNIGRTVLFRKVKGLTGYAPKEYVRVVRLKKAAELLKETDMNISQVAYAVGIYDPFYFSKCFKQQFGVAPSAYRKGE